MRCARSPADSDRDRSPSLQLDQQSSARPGSGSRRPSAAVAMLRAALLDLLAHNAVLLLKGHPSLRAHLIEHRFPSVLEVLIRKRKSPATLRTSYVFRWSVGGSNDCAEEHRVVTAAIVPQRAPHRGGIWGTIEFGHSERASASSRWLGRVVARPCRDDSVGPCRHGPRRRFGARAAHTSSSAGSCAARTRLVPRSTDARHATAPSTRARALVAAWSGQSESR